MSSAKPKDIAKLLQERAQKLASAPTVPSAADGVTETKKVEPSTDPGLAELRQDLPADGTQGDDIKGGQFGLDVTNPSETPHADKANPKGEQVVAKAAAADPKSRINAIRGAIGKATGTAKADAPATTTAAVADPEKSAAAAPGELDLSQETLAKVAKVILSTEEGVAYATSAMARHDGEQSARAMIKEARAAADQMTNEQALVDSAVEEAISKSASYYAEICGLINEDEADSILKQAAAHEEALLAFDHPLLKQAYAEGMEDAAALEGAEEAGAAPEIPMGGEQLAMEDIVMLLQEMVASGQVSAEEVQAALAELGAAGGDPAAGAVDPAAAAVEDPAAAAAAEAPVA